MKNEKKSNTGIYVTRALSLICIIALMVIGLSSCVDQSSGASHSKKSSANLIATSPAAAEICNHLDLDLVGVCKTSHKLPERYRDIPQVGLPMNPDLEVIKSLSPDYVISPSSLENDLKPKYESIDVKPIFLDLKSVNGMYDSMDQLGEKFGRQKQAEKMRKEYDSFMKDWNAKNKGKDKPKVLVLMGLPGSYIVATPNSYVGSLVEMAGGINVFSDTDKEFLNANTEEIKQTEPDVILRAAHAMPEDVKAMFADEFKTNQIWKHFNAVKNGRVYDLDPSLFGMSATFAYPEALEELQPMLYEK